MLETKGILIATTVFCLLAIALFNSRQIRITTAGWFSERKRTELRYIVYMLLFWLFAACVVDSADLSNYRWAYENRISHGKEPLFDIVQFYFHDIGWSFDSFQILWASIISVLLFAGIKKYSKRPSKVVALAMITILAGFITQMRSALVGAIFINAFQLVISGKRRDRIIYLFVVLFSAQIHIVGYCFLIFLLINKNQVRAFKKPFYILIAFVTLVALFGSSFASSYINSVIRLFSSGGTNAQRALSYFSGEKSHFRYAFFLICKHLFLYYLTNDACKKQINESNMYANEESKSRIIREANTLMLVFLPVTILSASFERLFLCFAIIQYSMVFNVGRRRFSLFNRLSLSLSMQSVLVIGVLVLTITEWYFNSSDLVRILNSTEWLFNR